MADTGLPIRHGSAQQQSVELGGLCVTDVVFPAWLTLPSHYHARACFAIISRKPPNILGSTGAIW
jgi:hypothetical protein